MTRNRIAFVGAFLPVCLICASAVYAQSNWVDFTDETATRIIGNPAVTTQDPEEKDIAIGDLDNDGDMDAVICRKTPFSNPGGKPNVVLINRRNRLVDLTKWVIPAFLIPDDSRDVVIFDANGDGWNDILTVNTFFEQPRLFINQGPTRQQNTQRSPWFVEDTNWMAPFSPAPMFCAAAAGDIDNDGDMDLFFSDYNNNLEDRLCINDGTGNFTDETTTRMTPQMSESAFGTGCIIWDFNNDGWADICKISTLFDPSVLRLLINDGTGNYLTFQDLPFDQVYMIEKADFDNNGRMDLYVESDNQDYLLINNSTNGDGTINMTQVNVTNSDKTSEFGGNVHAAFVDDDNLIDFGVADVDVDIPGCDRRFCILRNTPGRGLKLEDPNDPTNLSWNTQGNHDFGWIDVNNDGKVDILQGTCAGLRVFIQN